MANKSKRVPRQGTCVYCGTTGDVEDEHVLARRLFVGGNPDPIFVDACNACNQQKSQGERDLRNLMAIDYWGSQHPDTDSHIERIRRHEPTANWLWEQVQVAPPEPVLDDDGKVVDVGYAIAFNDSRARTAIETIIRGLWFHETGRNHIPLNSIPVLVEFKERKDAKMYVQGLTRQLPHPGIRRRGNNAVWWIPFIPPETPQSSAWLLCFNNQLLCMAYTGSLALKRAEFLKAKETKQTESSPPSASAP